MPRCPSCGKEYTAPAAFCPSCGAVLDRPQTAGVSPTVGASPTAASAGPSPAATDTAQPTYGDIGLYIVRRFFALLVDVIGVGALLATLLYFAVGHITKSDVETKFSLLTFGLIVAGALFLYLWLMEGLTGSTLGKLLFALGVGRPSGRAGMGRSLVRNLLRPIDLALIGFILAAVTHARRRLGDFAAGTVVANSRLGLLAPLIALAALGGVGWVDYAYADGMNSAKRIIAAAQAGWGSAPAPAQSPTPTLTPPAAAESPSPTQSASASPMPAPSATPSAALPSPLPTGS